MCIIPTFRSHLCACIAICMVWVCCSFQESQRSPQTLVEAPWLRLSFVQEALTQLYGMKQVQSRAPATCSDQDQLQLANIRKQMKRLIAFNLCWVSMAASGRRPCSSWWLLHGTVIQEAMQPVLKGFSCQCEEEKGHEEWISWLVVPFFLDDV